MSPKFPPPRNFSKADFTLFIAEAEASSSIVMNVDPLDHVAKREEPEVSQQNLQDLDDSILPVLPRQPTVEEHTQKFMMYSVPTDPPNFMRYCINTPAL